MSARPKLRLVCQDLCTLVPDKAAQAAWDRVYKALDDASNALSGIAWLTVAGEQSTTRLHEAADLIERAAAILERSAALEDPFFHELTRVAPKQMEWGDRPELENDATPGKGRS